MTLTEPEKLWQNQLNKFYINEKFLDASEIVNEERAAREFKSLYVKHAFDALGQPFKRMYLFQMEFVKELKKQYKDKYEA